MGHQLGDGGAGIRRIRVGRRVSATDGREGRLAGFRGGGGRGAVKGGLGPGPVVQVARRCHRPGIVVLLRLLARAVDYLIAVGRSVWDRRFAELAVPPSFPE